MNTITKAVFPVAGLGSRFLPATKASPKEMMPIVDKPLIQYAVEEAVAAGATELIFITGRNKRAIEDHFDTAHELETALESNGKTKLLQAVRSVLPANVSCIFVRQGQALGLGHAVLCARKIVGNEPFAVILADDLIDAQPGALTQLVTQHRRHPYSIIGIQDVQRNETDQYGIVKCDAQFGAVSRITDIVEKPRPADAPSTLGVVGRYILTSAIFDHLASIQPGAGGEIQLTDAIHSLMREEPVLACEFKGTRYDCGSKLGYLKATLAFGVNHPEVGGQFAQYLEAFAMARAKLHSHMA